MITNRKVTKKDSYNAILDILTVAESTGVVLPDGVTFASLNDFINHEIELLDNKAAAAAKRAADKKTVGDALRERVLNVLSTDTAMTLAEISNALNDPDVSSQMITARLTQLGSKGTEQVEKVQVTVESAVEGGKNRKVSAYRRIG